MNNFPKVLIIGPNFDNTGGGITLANLFLDWPKDKIAVASVEIEMNEKNVCDNFYRLGYLERKNPFPFYLHQRKYYSGIVNTNNQINYHAVHSQTIESKFRKKIKNFYNEFLHKIGLFHYIDRISPSVEFLRWMRDFSPDIIYTQLSSIGLIRFIKKINDSTNVPFVIHVMDDWPETIVKKGLFSNYWKKKIDIEFKELINRSCLLMTICQTMSDEYKLRYGNNWLPFHNPIDLEIWEPGIKLNWNLNNPIRILYAGKLSSIRVGGLIDVCEAISKLREEGFDIIFEVRTPTKNEDSEKMLNRYPFVNINTYIRHSEMPVELRKMDILLITLNFDKETIRYTRLSMPTKATDYMASGTPILVYAPAENAVVQYAKKEKWAFVVDTQNTNIIKTAIRTLITDASLREKLSKVAVDLVFKNHETKEVKTKFQNQLINAVMKKRGKNS